MKKSIDQLKTVLSQEIDIYKEILQLAIKKTDIIVAGKIKKLEEITEKEQELIIKIGKLEGIRENVIFNLKNKLELNEELDMSKINDYLDDEEKECIEKKKDELLGILNNLKERNILNGSLINDSLEYINLNIDLLTNTSIDNNYDNKQKDAKSTQTRRIFDTKA